MAWARTVCGRLESRYRYSAGVVYNNFVWPISPTEAQIKAVEHTAEVILAVRLKYANASFADLYDPLTMPADLMKAHEANNKAVDKAYGYKGCDDDASRVAFLFKHYERITSLLVAESSKMRRKSS